MTLVEFQWLIKENQIPHTFKYVASGFLGQDSLPGGFEALYNLDGMVVKGFVIGCNDTDQASKCLRKFFLVQNRFKDGKLQTLEDGFLFYHRHTGHLLVKQYNRWLYGTVAESNVEVCHSLSNEIMENLISIAR
jgi:hypothetical protein